MYGIREMDGVGRGRRGGAPQVPRALLAGLLLLAAFAVLVALSSAASAHHQNPTCQAGGFTATWTGPTVLGNSTVINDSCILVQGDIFVPDGGVAHFRSTVLTFANNVSGNITVHLAANSTWRMSDFAGDLDRSALTVWNTSVLGSGFFFENGVNASVFFDDTDITGGGVPNQNLTNLSGIYFHALRAFSWNNVTHRTWANGLLLVNMSPTGTLANYQISVGVPPAQGAVGIFLAQVGNRSFNDVRIGAIANGVLINDSQNLSFYNYNPGATVTALTANRVAGLLIQDMTDVSARAASVDLNQVINGTLRRLSIKPPANVGQGFAVQLDSARNTAIFDSDFQNQAGAGLHTQLGTRDLLVDNVTMRNGVGSTHRGIWAEESADIFTVSNFTFRNVTVSNHIEAANLTGVGRALFQNCTLSAGTPVGTTGLALWRSFDVRFLLGLIQGAAAGAVFSGDNLTLESSTVSGNTIGLYVSETSFRVENVTFSSNTYSIRSLGAPRIGPSIIANSTVPSGSIAVGADAVVLTSADSSPFSRLLVFHNRIVNQLTLPSTLTALRLSTFGRVDVINNTFIGLSINVSNTGTLFAAGNSYQVSVLPLGAAVIFFDNGSSLGVSDETFSAPTPPLGLGTIVRAPYLSSQAEVRSMRMPLADYGVWISANPSSSLVTMAAFSNLTLSARRDALSTSGINTVFADDIWIDGSINGIFAFGGGTAQDLAVRNAFVTATNAAVNLTADSAGKVTAINLSMNRSAPPPARVLSIQGGSLATIARIDVDRMPVAIVATDTRRIVMSDQNFSNNAVGLRMDGISTTSVVLNWTIDGAARVENSSLRIVGDIIVRGAALTLKNASISIFALASDPRLTHFFFEGASSLAVSGGTSIITEPAQGGRITDSRFTLQLSPQAVAAINPSPAEPRALFEGLGDIAASDPAAAGIYLRAQGGTFYNVQIINGSRPVFVANVAVTFVNCTFVGVSGALAAVTATANATVRLSRCSVTGHDGIDATDADANIDGSSFSGAGIVLSIRNGRGTLDDSTVQFSSKVVEARNASVVSATRVSALDIFQAVFDADTDSSITVALSYLDGDDGTVDAVAKNGAAVNFENTYVDRFGEFARAYNVQTSPQGTFTATWGLQLAACVLSDRSRPVGSIINVTGPDGSVIFSGPSQSDGLTIAFRFLEFESHNGASTYHVPFKVLVRVGDLSTSADVLFTNQSVVELCLDDVPPELRIIAKCTSPTREARCEITVQTRDEDSALAPGFPCLSVRGGDCLAKGQPVPVPTLLLTTQIPLLEGDNPWCWRAEDLYGNKAELCDQTVLDLTPPQILTCVPAFTLKTENATVELTCQIDGDPTQVVFGGLQPPFTLDEAAGTLHATIALQEGPNLFDFSVTDALGNLYKQTFSWTRDTEAPTITLHTDLSRVANSTRLLIKGQVTGDTVNFTFNGRTINVTGGQFNFFWDLETEGVNNGSFRAVDDVGNQATREVSATRDTDTGCSLLSPEQNLQTGESPVLLGGRCDTDVALRVNGQAVSVGSDGRWSVMVPLAPGPNTITIFAQDTHDATWYAEARVYYVSGGTPANLAVLLLFALLAGGTLAAAYFISRRPRAKPEDEPQRASTGAQKAPPRPKPMTVKLPEVGEDETLPVKPPQPPPPPPRP